MGGYSAQYCTRAGIKVTRTEERSAAHQLHHNHDHDGQQGRYQAGSGQAAKRLFSHHYTSYRNNVA